MSWSNPGPGIGMDAGGAVAKYRRVKQDANGKAIVCGDGATDGNFEIGVSTSEAFAADERLSVALRGGDKVTEVEGDGAIAIGDDLYGAASGRVSATVSGDPRGVAMSATSATGEIVAMKERG